MTPLSMLLAVLGCTAQPPQPKLVPITLSQAAVPQRPAPAHRRRIARTAHPAAPAVVVLPATPAFNKAQTEEKERLFRGFVDWQGAQDTLP